MTETVAHTGIPSNTLRRRVDAWLDDNEEKIESGYAIRGTHGHGGRLVNGVDAERARLQHLVLLDARVTAGQWARMVLAGDLPAQVTDARWWPEAVQWLRDQPAGPVP